MAYNERRAAMLSLYRMFLLKGMARTGSVVCLTVAVGVGATLGFESNGSWWLGGLSLVLFPAGVLVGELLAWRWEGLGSLLAVASLAVFYMLFGAWLSGDWLRDAVIFLFSAPAFLFLMDWLMANWTGSTQRKAGQKKLKDNFYENQY